MPSSHLNHQVHKWCGVQNGKKSIGLYKEIIFMNNDIKFLNIEWRAHIIPSQILKTVLGSLPQLFFRLQYVWFPVHLYTG